MSKTSTQSATSALVAVRDRREEIIELLCDSYAADLIEEEDFEKRLDLAHRASNLVTLNKIVSDIELTNIELTNTQKFDQAIEPSTEKKITEKSAQLAISRKQTSMSVAVMGGLSRSGQWYAAKKNRVLCLMGSVDLDLRDVQLPPGVTQFNIYTLMGGVNVIVPPGVAVDCDGISIMGGFDNKASSPKTTNSRTPIVRIRGVAIMGGFEITTRLPGESARQARKRRKLENKARLLSASSAPRQLGS